MTKASSAPWGAEEGAAFQRKVHMHLVLRLLAAVFLLAVTFLFQLRLSQDISEPVLNPLYAYAAVLFSVTLLSACVLPMVRRHGLFAAGQFAFDILAVTFLIYLTGGVTSPFPFLFMAVIMAAAVLFQRRGSLLVAAASTIAYGALLDLQYFRWVNPLPFMGRTAASDSSEVYFYTLVVMTAAFFLVAFISGYLATELQKWARLSAQKSRDMERLESFYRQLVESLGAGLMTTDAHGIITYANRAALNLLQTDARTLEGQPLECVFPALGLQMPEGFQPKEATPWGEEDSSCDGPLSEAGAQRLFSGEVRVQERSYGPAQSNSLSGPRREAASNRAARPQLSKRRPTGRLNAIEGREGLSFEASHVLEIVQESAAGEKRSFVVTISPLKTTPQAQDRIIVFQDQTHIKALQERMRRLEQLAFAGKMAGEIVHDIKNPLAAVSGVAQMMAAQPQEDETSRRLQDILVREIDRLNLLVSRFLWIAREGKASEKPEPVAVGETVRHVLDALTISKHLSGRHHVHVDVPDDLKVTLVPRYLFQILWHLVANAAEALPNGGLVHIGARPHTGDDGRSGVLVKVADSGPGVSGDVAKKMFEPLFTTKEGHLGLGLSLVCRLVEEANGHIEVGSSAAFPMCVRLFFPQA
ncbi:two-component system sensor histidine kinase NtrB [Desulfosoma caldarium]|uniref:histidine kinase n=1 Tax=Desulfosoma caldarium TaxID=610254 RepID=A0A3N1VIT3_9BACT|nr:ATP-binding protein [Desulfosoma caldarium]ROR01949.1 PAS domain-containing protein [Desulfosoma caldarium]